MKDNIISVDFTAEHRKKKRKKLIESIIKYFKDLFRPSKKYNNHKLHNKTYNKSSL